MKKIRPLPLYLFLFSALAFAALLLSADRLSKAGPPLMREYYVVEANEIELHGFFRPCGKLGNARDVTLLPNALTFKADVVEGETFLIDPEDLDDLPRSGPLDYVPESIPGNLKLFVEPDGRLSFDFSPGEGIPFIRKNFYPGTGRARIWSDAIVGEAQESDYDYRPPQTGATIIDVYDEDTIVISGYKGSQENKLALILEVTEDEVTSIFAAKTK